MTIFSATKRHRILRPLVRGLFVIAWLAVAWLPAQPGPALAEVFRSDGSEDAVLRQVAVDEKLGADLPLDAEFSDQDGSPVRLGDCLGGKPSILVLNFFSCPMLCPVTFRRLTESLNGMDALSLGRDYRVIALSFDPEDTPGFAKEKADEIYGMLDSPPADKSDFPFLTGGQDAITRVTGSVGYGYVKLEEGFAHPAVAVILTPDGRVSRYLYGIEHEPRDLKLALIEASGGSIGGPGIVNKALLYCYQYDPGKDGYTLVAVNVMKLGGLLTVIVVGGLFLALWLKERKGHGAS